MAIESGTQACGCFDTASGPIASRFVVRHTRSASQPTHLYRGHRGRHLRVDDIDELTEWRARQRTFDGAYTRTALSCSVYALAILKIFHKDFAKIGLAYVGLALALLFISGVRRRRLHHDFADKHFPQPPSPAPSADQDKIWGREYRTPGDIVLMLTAVVAALQISLIFLIANLN